jgi:hypothetical protein
LAYDLLDPGSNVLSVPAGDWAAQFSPPDPLHPEAEPSLEVSATAANATASGLQNIDHTQQAGHSQSNALPSPSDGDDGDDAPSPVGGGAFGGWSGWNNDNQGTDQGDFDTDGSSGGTEHGNEDPGQESAESLDSESAGASAGAVGLSQGGGDPSQPDVYVDPSQLQPAMGADLQGAAAATDHLQPDNDLDSQIANASFNTENAQAASQSWDQDLAGGSATASMEQPSYQEQGGQANSGGSSNESDAAASSQLDVSGPDNEVQASQAPPPPPPQHHH